MGASFCPHCGRELRIQRTDHTELEDLSPLEGEPSAPGIYYWGGSRYSFDIARVAGFLGKRTDTELARVAGTTRLKIRQVRRQLGIPTYHRLRAFEHLLGKYTDTEIARRSGSTLKTVSKYRRRLGIPPCPLKKVRAAHRLEAYLDALEKLFENIPERKKER